MKNKTGRAIIISATKNYKFSQRDQQFINKLQKIIALNYQDAMIVRSCLASSMAISERHLQRKTAALIGQSPMEMLKDYRLSKATLLLRDGCQVCEVACQCGFNSPSYFSQCFKSKYGASPKQYQKSLVYT